MGWRRREARVWSGSLIVGLSLAKGLALARNKPLVGVHHLEAHVFSNLIAAQVEGPFLTLLVSGGHTELILVRELGSYEVLGPHARRRRRGEAFDKVAKLLGLLPGGRGVRGWWSAHRRASCGRRSRGD